MPDGVVAPPRPVTPSTILADELTEICRQLELAPGADPALVDRVRRSRDLAAGMDPYLDACTTRESPALAELARRTRSADWSTSTAGTGLEQEMLSGHVEGQVLKFLVHLSRAERILEIGMFTGYSALAMAEAMGDNGEVLACEMDPEVARFAQECFEQSDVGQRIAVAVGPASETLERLAAADRQFDLVFIDADKPGYTGYLQQLLDGELLAPGAVIAVDNTLMQGQPWLDDANTANGAAIAAFNAALTYDDRIEQVLIPLRDGLTLIRRVDR
ncbi:O-methyltransferase [Williamsia phyllosphaerae]|uniref:O-methyltransferase n=1 Tax=Williamsia phyllosphaerae TaxID=885042 RepID=A0ABQ1UZB1_9NOCA|nr:class I SAM-dependent methyltransferase [Williamsia phyllosphaerae]GGF30111.1 O-methyltransferase [Williamsia phyllosphaerae]